MPLVLYPGSTSSSWRKLASKSPAPKSRENAKIICATTRLCRTRRVPFPPVPVLSSSRRTSCNRCFASPRTETAVMSVPAAMAISKATPITLRSMLTSEARGKWLSPAIAKPRTTSAPSETPTAQLMAANIRFSQRNCPISLAPAAPNASLVAISFFRRFTRASARFATFSAPIISTNTAPAHSRYSNPFTSFTSMSCRGSTTLWKPALTSSSFICGNFSRLAAFTAFTWACAC